jgi:hypothetical protein
LTAKGLFRNLLTKKAGRNLIILIGVENLFRTFDFYVARSTANHEPFFSLCRKASEGSMDEPAFLLTLWWIGNSPAA